jgi:hypothetical protein
VKVLFLDIDGVLNSNAWYKQYGDQNIPRPPLDRDAVRRLDRIVRTTGAFIVLSTSWRGDRRIPVWLLVNGCSGAVVGRTPRFSGRERGDEISAWLNRQARVGVVFERFVILDDGDDMGRLRPWLVQTTQDYGLQDAEADAAIAMLNE